MNVNIRLNFIYMMLIGGGVQFKYFIVEWMKNVIFLDRVMVVIIGKMKKRIKLKSKSKIFKYYVE